MVGLSDQRGNTVVTVDLGNQYSTEVVPCLLPAEREQLVRVCERVEIPGFGVVTERVGNGVRKLVQTCNLIGNRVDLVHRAVTGAKVDPSLEQPRRPVDFGRSEYLGFHNPPVQVQNVQILVG